MLYLDSIDDIKEQFILRSAIRWALMDLQNCPLGHHNRWSIMATSTITERCKEGLGQPPRLRQRGHL